MTALTAHATSSRPDALPRLTPTQAHDSVRFSSLFRAEARKVVNTRTSRWLMVAIAGLTAAGFAGAVTLLKGEPSDPPLPWTNATFLVGIGLMLLVPVMGVLLVTQEWSMRTSLTTFTVEPRRGRIVAAKALVALTLIVVAHLVMLALAAIAALVLQSRGVDVDWTMHGWRLLGDLTTNTLSMAVAFALALALMNAPAALIGYLALPSLVTMLGLAVPSLAKVAPWIDLSGASQPLSSGSLTGAEWAHLASATAIWIVLPTAIGVWRHLTTEVK